MNQITIGDIVRGDREVFPPYLYEAYQSTRRRAVRSGVHLRQAALEEEQVQSILSPEEIDRALDPGAYLGNTDAFIDRVLASYREVQSSGGGV